MWNRATFDGAQPTLLWEADPERFGARYPDSGIERSYGDQWPPPCIDYWVYVDPETMVARLSVEGWSVSEHIVELSGDGLTDGQLLATAFAAILRVPWPGAHGGSSTRRAGDVAGRTPGGSAPVE